jgi:SAM-dependent MidA family methyltransferase
MEQLRRPSGRTRLKLIAEHEMGELFKVIGFCTGEPWDALGFTHGDRAPWL